MNISKKFPKIQFFGNSRQTSTNTDSGLPAQRLHEEPDVPTVSVQVDLEEPVVSNSDIIQPTLVPVQTFRRPPRNTLSGQILRAVGVAAAVILVILLAWIIAFTIKLIMYAFESYKEYTNEHDNIFTSDKNAENGFNYTLIMKSNAQAEFTTKMNHKVAKSFKSDLCISFMNEVKAYCADRNDLRTCHPNDMELGVKHLLNSIINRTANFYRFSWVQQVTEVSNLLIKVSNGETIVVNFDVLLALHFNSREGRNHLSFNDFKTRIEVLFSFCDIWFNNFILNDLKKLK